MKRVVIAGGGIIGAAIAWQLGRRSADCECTLVEMSRPAAGATKDSFAWINATFSKQPRHYYELNRQGIAAWRRLEGEMPAPPQIQWGGSVEWYAAGSEAGGLRESVQRHAAWGYPTRAIDAAELRELLPEIDPGEVAAASFSEEEGVVDPVAATEALLAAAGAVVRYPCEVMGLDLDAGRVRTVHTTQGALPADVFVVACGTGSPRVAAMAGVKVPLKDSPGVLAHTRPQPPRLGRLVFAPGSHIKQDSSGRIVGGDNFAGSDGPEAGGERGAELLRAAKRYLRNMDPEVERVSLGWRVMPADEFPIVGFAAACPNLYVVATHSGVTLAPLLAEFAAREILDGGQVPALAPYRLSRFG